MPIAVKWQPLAARHIRFVQFYHLYFEVNLINRIFSVGLEGHQKSWVWDGQV